VGMKEKNGEHPFGDAGQLILLLVFLVVWISDSFLLHASAFFSKFLPLTFRLVILSLTLLTTVYLVKSGHVVVSHEHKPDFLVTTGAFRYVRHPLYLASILTYLGLAISTASLASLALLAAIFVFYNYIAGYEERILEEKFGNNYRTYMKKTGKWIPHIDQKHR